MSIPNASPFLYNEDLAPAVERKWGAFSIFNVWTSDVHSLWGYYLAASLFLLCGSFVNFVLAIGIGSLVIFLPDEPGRLRRRQDRGAVSGARARVVRRLGREYPGAGARDRRLLLVRRANCRRLRRDRRAADAHRHLHGVPQGPPTCSAIPGWK